MKTNIVNVGNLKIGGDNDLVFIAGPCVVESQDICFEIAEFLLRLSTEKKVGVIFKASFDKANRTSGSSFRGVGVTKSLGIFSEIRSRFGIPVLTDIHETIQADWVVNVVDIIQIPAFLCRQTDLLISAAKTGKVINVKKGQFLSPYDVKWIIKKIESEGNTNILITERGTTFGYNNLVVDMRGIPIMQEFGYPVVFDATHSVQMPGGNGASSGGQPQYASYLAKAAVAVGCNAIFAEIHPNPKQALSDRDTMLTLNDFDKMVDNLVEINRIVRNK